MAICQRHKNVAPEVTSTGNNLGIINRTVNPPFGDLAKVETFTDLLSHVRSIADFLNRPLTDDIISRIAEQSSFSAMKKDRDSVLTVPFKDGRNVPILRKGVVGDWKNYFTPELNERFEKEVLAKLQGSGLEIEVFVSTLVHYLFMTTEWHLGDQALPVTTMS
ncbi:hypothetical protein pdam_00014798 [Pocillopora damicornis]|uniref:Sulfotransferase domain-containing protein n=1 Tax=Pocillopora damicornis TaxID=46731 RepID=A0A3M6U748_POCDA|nr:hypothetical protein pdam_00014798 [Pocillopora damicornis]